MPTTMKDTTKAEMPAWLNVEAFGTDQERGDLISDAEMVAESLRYLSPGIREIRNRAVDVVHRFDRLATGAPDGVYDHLREALGVQAVDDLCMLILGDSAEGTGLPTEEYLAKLQEKYGASLPAE